jgi:plastocyanin
VLDGGQTVFVVGAIGGDTGTKEGSPMKAGTYEFWCTIHPGMDGGTFITA